MDTYAVLRRGERPTLLCDSPEALEGSVRAVSAYLGLRGSRLLLIGAVEPWVVSASRDLSLYKSRFGVEIEQIGQAGTYNVSDAWNSTLRNAVLTKSGDYDSAAIYASTGSALAVEGLYYNVLDLPHVNLDQPWWNKSIVNEVTLFDTLYYLAGDIAITEVAGGVCFFFNKDLFTELYQTQNIDLYTMVEEQKWTIDKLHELVAGAWVDENSDGVISDGDTVGYGAGACVFGRQNRQYRGFGTHDSGQ
jgi:hypothetical protein